MAELDRTKFDPATGQPGQPLPAATVVAVGAPVGGGMPMVYANPTQQQQPPPVYAQPGAVSYTTALYPGQAVLGVGTLRAPTRFRTELFECSGENASQANCCLSLWLPCWAYARIRTLAGVQDANPAGGWTMALGSSLLLFSMRYAAQVWQLSTEKVWVHDDDDNHGDTRHSRRSLASFIAAVCSMLVALMIWDLRTKVKRRHAIVTDDCGGGNGCDDCLCSLCCSCCVLQQMENQFEPNAESCCGMLNEPVAPRSLNEPLVPGSA